MLGLGSSLTTSVVSSGIIPSDVGGLALWFKPDTTGTILTAAEWKDSSGNNNHMTQGTSSNQADVNADGGLDFEGSQSDSYNLTNDVIIAAEEAIGIFLVCDIESFTDGGSQNTFLGTGGTSAFLEIQNASRMRFKTSTSSDTDIIIYATNSFAAGTKMMLYFQRESGSTGEIKTFKNGSELDIDSYGASSDNENPGAITFDRVAQRAGDRFFDGDINELIVYDADLSDADRNGIFQYLSDLHGVALS